MGQIGSSGESRVRIYASEGSSTFNDYGSTSTPINTDSLHKWVHNGSDDTYTVNGNAVTFTDSKTHSKIRRLNVSNNKIQGLKIKPL